MAKMLNYNEYLPNKTFKWPNPFNEFGFRLYSGECFMDTKCYYVCDVCIEYENHECHVSFDKNSTILGLVVIASHLCNNWGFDANVKVYLNNTKLDIDKPCLHSEWNTFDYLIDNACIMDNNVCRIVYSRDEYGDNAYKVNMSTIIFTETSTTLELENFDKECDRRRKENYKY